MPQPRGFICTQRADGTVVVTHHGRTAATLRGGRAEKFLAEVASGDPQLVMARWTGAYRFGNERTAREHPRNRSGRTRKR
ncbi:hypothetical protein [Streptomyces roseicoloratus]|uniref:Hydrophilic protein n=1 Tax=Streptomyces roseicoloratus TaxID=2508722 RepID=A0ABY9S2K3_9ACTN|nr:hypothetical protein [Streptomyces roseicoloratus]WMX47669.1 hypothetical protein RGF97_26645 [Streptomyces roseicoloratus]